MAKTSRIINDTSHLQHNKEHYHGTARHVALLAIAHKVKLQSSIQNHHVAIRKVA